MDNFFDRVQKLQKGHLRELAGMCTSAALLLVAAAFISGGGMVKVNDLLAGSGIAPGSQTASIFPCSWFGDCPSNNTGYVVQSLTAAQSLVAPGAPATLSFTEYGCGPIGCAGSCYYSSPPPTLFGRTFLNATTYCAITPDAPTTDYSSGLVTNNTSMQTGVGTGPTSYVVYPTRTTTYYLCNGLALNYGQGCASATVTVASAATTLTSFTATPSSVISGTVSTLAWQGTKGAKFSACELTGGQWGSGAWFTALPGSIATSPLTATTIYSMNCFDTDGASTGWKSATITVTNDICTDIAGNQRSLPAGCTGPTPAPVGKCVPDGYTFKGSACVATSLCANGLNNSYSPSCTCPSGQYQPPGSASCTALPVCANGLNSAYSPSCTCPSGQVQVKGGNTCALQGVINTLTANPSRVLKGNKATISWSTANMATCTLSGFDASGTATLARMLSSSINPTVTNKTIYTLSCADKAGLTYSSSVTVNLIPQTIEQ